MSSNKKCCRLLIIQNKLSQEILSSTAKKFYNLQIEEC